MPLVAQWLGLLLPLTCYLEILRGILLKGAGLTQYWVQTVLLGPPLDSSD